ncbi:MAG: hypothetical protein ABIH26_15305 [Candidatus Eisenbacteria bacterium]
MRNVHAHPGVRFAAVVLLLAGLSRLGCAARETEPALGSRGAVAVLGFEDRSGRDDLAARISDHFAARLALGSYTVFDRVQVEAACREAGVAVPAVLAEGERSLLQETLGCEAVVTGLLASFEEGSLWKKPKVALSVRLVDLAGGETRCRLGGVVPRPLERCSGRDGERIALAFAEDLADRMNDLFAGETEEVR